MNEPDSAKEKGDYLPSIVSHFFRSPLQTIREEKTLVTFLIVGASGAVINELVLFAFASSLGKILAQALGVEISIISNFVWNDTFTFRKTRNNMTGRSRNKYFRLGKYNVLSLGTFALNLAIYTPLVTFVWKQGLGTYLSSIIAMLVAFSFNYFGSSRWAWKTKQDIIHATTKNDKNNSREAATIK
jgi:dolichol-phosphate mannosyltransferase